MKERPIVFTAEMVRAILEGRKTMTRRPVKHRHLTNANELDEYFGGGTCEDCDACFYTVPKDSTRICVKCPYGVPGDRLWVKETFRVMSELSRLGVALGCDPPEVVAYEANGDESVLPWQSPRFMPRWASRILLEIVSVRVERVQDISEDDAESEGVETWYWSQVDHDPEHPAWWKTPMVRVARERHRGSIAPDAQFAGLWDCIYAKKPESQWDANPWVWVVEFKVVTA